MSWADEVTASALQILHDDHADLDLHAIRGYAVWPANEDLVAAVYKAEWHNLDAAVYVGVSSRFDGSSRSTHEIASDFCFYSVKEPPGTNLRRATIDRHGVHWIGPVVEMTALPDLHDVRPPVRPVVVRPPLPDRGGWTVHAVKIDFWAGDRQWLWTPAQPVTVSAVPLTVDASFEVFADADSTPCTLRVRDPGGALVSEWDLDRPTLRPHEPSLGSDLWVGIAFTTLPVTGDYRVLVSTTAGKVLFEALYGLRLA